jgi:hypothetical protein
MDRRKINNVPNLEIHISQGTVKIGSDDATAPEYAAVNIDFVNHTGSVVYITGLRIRPRLSTFNVSIAANRDIAEGTFELAFVDPNTGKCVVRELTLHTNHQARTYGAVTENLPTAFYRLNSVWHRRWFRRPIYFVLEYVAVVGETRHYVATVY